MYQKQLKTTMPTVGWFVGLPETQQLVTVPLISSLVMHQKKSPKTCYFGLLA